MAPSGPRLPARNTSVPLGSTVPSGLRPCFTKTGSLALTFMSSGRTMPSGPRRPTRLKSAPGSTRPSGSGRPALNTSLLLACTLPSGSTLPAMKAGSDPEVHSCITSGLISSVPSGLSLPLRNTELPGTRVPGAGAGSILDCKNGGSPGSMEPSGLILPARNTTAPLGSTVPSGLTPCFTNTGSSLQTSMASGWTLPSGPRRPTRAKSPPGTTEPSGLILHAVKVWAFSGWSLPDATLPET
mmetsp:Transcript_14778/g.34629  ORF Transcript_14778/g.34629 Transcript_14778/m.34629 type:complete len:241 (+) Transcript_14778:810-1532(+)